MKAWPAAVPTMSIAPSVRIVILCLGYKISANTSAFAFDGSHAIGGSDVAVGGGGELVGVGLRVRVTDALGVGEAVMEAA